MRHTQKALWGTLLLGILCSASTRLGAQPLRGQETERMSPEARAALTASIPSREIKLALRERKDVLPEVQKRLQEMGVKASAEELTDLLAQAARLEIDLDKCSLGDLGAVECRILKTDLAGAERSFRDKTGLSMHDFRAGRRETPAPAARTGPRLQTKSQTCTCTFTVYSLSRWMSPYWALECNGHGGHGYCSNDVDTAHSPGTGAMTGDLDLYFGGGAYHLHRSCPDDHYTCFHGPSTDEPGEWGNVCSCDFWHSQNGYPTLAWYGGALTDSLPVDQFSTPWVTVGGSCNGAYVSVKEYVQEHDPICCDDPMGDLWVTVPVADGPGFGDGQASYQNCSGGSQSGVWPNCGTFGATIRIAYICQTYGTPPPPPPVCDPAAEQYCWDTGGYWDPSNCSCTMPCIHNANCAEWDDVNCVCLRA
jgi:hypothetical protein